MNPLTAIRTRISSKILIVAVIGMVLTAVTGAVGMWQIRTVADKGQAIYNEALTPTQEVARLRDAVGRVRVDGLSRVIATSQNEAAQVAQWTNALQADEATIDQIHAGYDARDLPAPERDALKRFWAAWLDYREARVLGDQASREGRTADFVRLRNERMTPDVQTATKALDELVTASATTASQRLAQAEQAGTRALALMGAAMLVGLVVAITVGLLVARSIVRPLHRLRDVLRAVADGDLRARAEVTNTDEVGEMAGALNSTLVNVGDVVRQIGSEAVTLANLAQSRLRAGDEGGGSVVMSSSDDTATELVGMAESLNKMIRIFAVDEMEPAS